MASPHPTGGNQATDLQQFSEQPLRRVDAQQVHFADLANMSTGRTPVLHLHGRIGWYYSEDGQVHAVDPDASFNDGLGVPALLLPDREKVYEDPASVQMWEQFERALGGSNRVLVLGHSLNDPRLIAALSQTAPQSLGVTLFTASGDHDAWVSEISAVRERLGREAHFIPMRFGPEPHVMVDAFLRWREGANPGVFDERIELTAMNDGPR